jgi:hypothetical protein
MRTNKLVVSVSAVGFVATAVAMLFAGEPTTGRSNRLVHGTDHAGRTAMRADSKPSRASRQTGGTGGVAAAAHPRAAVPRTLVTPITEMTPIAADGGAAGTGSGTTVYNNTIDPVPAAYPPGADEMMADEIQLAGGACEVSYYEIVVLGFADPGSPATFDAHTALWDGDPCLPSSSVIAGTEGEFLSIANDQSGFALSATFDTPIAAPGTVYLSVTFTTDDAAWVIAEEAELGNTPDFFSEDDATEGCVLFTFQATPNQPDYYAGFWATVNCQLAGDPPGACCNGTSCSEVTEVDCLAGGGTWRGAFSSCTPNPCLTGACCTGANFQTCGVTSQAACRTGLFHASEACGPDTCGPTFHGFANNFNTGSFAGIDTGTMWADDIQFANVLTVAGRDPSFCDLAGYDLMVTGDNAISPTFDVTVELWTNNDLGTADELDDEPLAPITGTLTAFAGVPANLFGQRLVAGEFQGVELPEKVWMVLDVTSDLSGPLLGGDPAKLGDGEDAFAVFNSDASPNQWLGGFIFCDNQEPPNCGFSAEGCPANQVTCIPAGSFRANVWCHGDRPTGACCDDGSGECLDGVTALMCSGRFVQGASCDDPGTFEPVCGTNACCFPNPANPTVPICANLTLADCASVDGAVAAGLTCNEISCPGVDCLGQAGDCFEEHQAPGCDDAFCCEQVCSRDPNCCASQLRWDNVCVDEAGQFCTVPPGNDERADAEAIAGEGTFGFDTTLATTDGPESAGCSGIDNLTGIENDVWFCWSPNCTDMAFLSTCGSTDVDTKIAVYEDCTQPPSDLSLLACNDDTCNFQTQASFPAIMGQTYLIRVGSFPGMDGGEGSLEIQCGPPHNGRCPGAVDCCTGNPSGNPDSPGCVDPTCCDSVCACDSFCCDTDWDEFCAGTGENNNGCGAAALCGALCGTCPTGTVTWLDPPDGVVDAALPLDPGTGEPLGIQTVVVRAPTGAHAGCFELCETLDTGSANDIMSVEEDLGIYTLTLLRPITPRAVTTITYLPATSELDLGEASTAEFTSHPGNTNGNGIADGNDVLGLVQFLMTGSTASLPWGTFGYDLDRDGRFLPDDLLAGVDMLVGAGILEPPTLGTTLPETNGLCP